MSAVTRLPATVTHGTLGHTARAVPTHRTDAGWQYEIVADTGPMAGRVIGYCGQRAVLRKRGLDRWTSIVLVARVAAAAFRDGTIWWVTDEVTTGGIRTAITRAIHGALDLHETDHHDR